MREPFEPKILGDGQYCIAYALVFIGQAIMYGLYLVAEAIKHKK